MFARRGILVACFALAYYCVINMFIGLTFLFMYVSCFTATTSKVLFPASSPPQKTSTECVPYNI